MITGEYASMLWTLQKIEPFNLINYLKKIIINSTAIFLCAAHIDPLYLQITT